VLGYALYATMFGAFDPGRDKDRNTIVQETLTEETKLRLLLQPVDSHPRSATQVL
jgi:hypothetical protein